MANETREFLAELYRQNAKEDESPEETAKRVSKNLRGVSRRELMEGAGIGAGALGIGGLLGFGGSEMVGTASADASTSDSDGNFGTPSDPADAFLEGLAGPTGSPVDVGAGLVPDADATHDLGSASAWWNNAHIEAVNNISYVKSGDDVQAKYNALDEFGLLWITEDVSINNPLTFNDANRVIAYSGALVPTNDATAVEIGTNQLLVNLAGSKGARFVSDNNSVIATNGNHGVHVTGMVDTIGPIESAAPSGGAVGHAWFFEDNDTRSLNYINGRFVGLFADGDGIRLEHTGTGSTDLNAWDVHLEARNNSGKGVNILDGVRGSAWIDVEANTGRGLDVGPNATQWKIRGLYNENNGSPARLRGDRCIGWILQDTTSGGSAQAPGSGAAWWKGSNIFGGFSAEHSRINEFDFGTVSFSDPGTPSDGTWNTKTTDTTKVNFNSAFSSAPNVVISINSSPGAGQAVAKTITTTDFDAIYENYRSDASVAPTAAWFAFV